MLPLPRLTRRQALLTLIAGSPGPAGGGHPARAAQSAAATATAPDIVIFITDDMRASDWDVLQPTRALIGGTWLPNFRYATPQCAPSRASLITGQYPHNTGVTRNRDGWPVLSRRRDGTLFTALAAASYRTVLLDKFINGYPGGTAIPGVSDPLALTDQPSYQRQGTYVTETTAEQAAGIIASTPNATPLLLHVGFVAPHGPANPAPADRKADVGLGVNKQDRQRRRTLLAVNRAVATVRDAMDTYRPGGWAGAVVLFLSDHGYIFPEDRGQDQRGKGNFYRQITQVPALLRIPGGGLGREDARLCSVIDLTPTLLDAAGAAATWTMDGRSLLDPWTRTGVYASGRSHQRAHHANTSFDAILSNDATFASVAPRDSATRRRQFAYYRDVAERDNHWHSLPSREKDALRVRLNRFKGCAGATCRAADQT